MAKTKTCFIIFMLMLSILALTACDERESPIEETVYITVINSSGEQEIIPLEEFLVGVVAGEMPAAFHEQALSAQAVAARTYIRRAAEQPRHGTALVCCDSTCCQAYLSESQLKQNWGDNFSLYYEKIRRAVEASRNQVLYYQGAAALTVYCSTCGGKTEAASGCWQQDIAYLQPRLCHWCEHSPRYTGAVTYSLEEAAAILNIDSSAAALLQAEAFSPGGRLQQISSPQGSWSGVELRQLLGLNSTACTWLYLGDNITFFTLGYGHGVGLCQYGADGLGQVGYSWQEILAHYYPGTELGSWQTKF